MIKFIFRIIFKELIGWFFKKKEETTNTYNETSLYELGNTINLVENKKNLLDAIDITLLPDPEIINPDGKITLMIVDDLDIAFLLYDSDFADLKRVHGEKCLDDFKIVKCHGQHAGNMAWKYLKTNKVDKALLDISLIKEPININGERVVIEGYDIAINLHKENPNMDIAVCTSNSIGMGSIGSVAGIYREIFEEYTKRDFMKAYINRNASRTIGVAELLFKDTYSYEQTKIRYKNEVIQPIE